MKFSEGIEFGAQISKYRLKMEDVEVACVYIILRKLCGVANRWETSAIRKIFAER